jgi:hypothetical protein
LPEELYLGVLVKLPRDAGWLLSRFGHGEVPDNYITEGEVGDAVRLVMDIRKPGRPSLQLVRELPDVIVGETEYRAAYGIVRATFDATYSVLQRTCEEDAGGLG